MSGKSRLHIDALALPALASIRSTISKISIVTPIRRSYVKEKAIINQIVPKFKNLKTFGWKLSLEAVSLRRLRCLNRLRNLFIGFPLETLLRVVWFPSYFKSLWKLSLDVLSGSFVPAKEDLPLVFSFFENFRLFKELKTFNVTFWNPLTKTIHKRILGILLSFAQDTRLMDYSLRSVVNDLELDSQTLKEALSHLDFLCLLAESITLPRFGKENRRTCFLQLKENGFYRCSPFLRACSSLKTLVLNSKFLLQIDKNVEFSNLESISIKFERNRDFTVQELQKLLTILNQIKRPKSFSLDSDMLFDSALPNLLQIFTNSPLLSIEELRLRFCFSLLSPILQLLPFQSLKRLKLDVWSVRGKEWIFPKGFFSHYPDLKELRLEIAFVPSDEQIFSLLDDFPQVEALVLDIRIGQLSKITASKFIERLKKCQSLESVELVGGCVGAFENVELQQFADDLIKMKTLKQVKIIDKKLNHIERRK